MKQLQRIFRRGIAATLCCAMLLQSTCVYAAGDETSVNNTADTSAPSVKTYGNDGTETGASDNLTDSNTNNNDNAADNGAADRTENSAADAAVDFSVVYADGMIRIRNAAQLAAIGTGAAVTSTDNEEGQLGQGTPVTNADSAQITYSPDAQYQLVNDIPLTAGSIWNLPAGFTGSFTSGDGSAVTKDAPLYDSATDTIYVYNSYQLDVIRSENAANEPVMSNDMIAEEFGMGQLVYPDGTPAEGDEAAAQGYLTYGPEHNYVLAMEFTAERPELKAEAVTQADGDHLYGRKYEGQVIWTDSDGTEYILIGNSTQLEAIGEKNLLGNYIQVTGPAYSYHALKDDKWELEYCGDADLDWSEKNNSGQLLDGEHPLTWYGVLEDTYKPSMGYPDDTLGDHATGKYYSPKENYIIFRDIDLKNDPWQPLMFSGQMEGRLDMAKNTSVTIKNVNVVQNGELPIDKYVGIGFFGTIANESDPTETVSLGKARVSHLILENVAVTNNSTEIEDDFSLGGLLLQWLVDLLAGVKNDPTTFATGGFAGRILGDAVVSDCEVKNLTKLSNVKDISGGFVGHIEGTTRYDFLLGGVSALLSFLSDVLNLIPGLGLGDLVTLLLNGGLLDVGNLLPTGYYSPTVENCKVTGISETEIGSPDTKFNGAFSGRQIGSTVTNCSVTSTTDLTVKAKNFGGGFSGAVVNSEIKGALNSLGVDLADAAFQSTAAGCTVNVPLTVQVSGAYAGGFTGTLANSYAIDPTVSQLKEVSGQTAVGGLVGYSTLGWGINADLQKTFGTYDDNLLDTVKKLLSELLTGDNQSDLLSLVGVKAAEIYGASVTGVNLKVTAADSYSGGLVGRSDGLIMKKSDQALLNELRPFEKETVSYTGLARGNTLTGLASVSAGKKDAGGVAGQLQVASAGGLLDTTLTIGNYMAFDVEDVSVTGTTGDTDSGIEKGYEVSAGENAGGGFGEAVGGSLTRVELNGLRKVSGTERAGGFAAVTGTGSLASSGGLNILGLDLISVSGLLSVADAIETKITDSGVTGIDEGFTVQADPEPEETSDVNMNIAGGFLGISASTKAVNCKVDKLKSVITDTESGIAGGFAAQSTASSLAGLLDGQTQIPGGILDINGLVNTVNYLIPVYKGCQVSFVSNGGEAQVKADVAGGFAGDFQSGTVNKLGDGETLPAGYDGYAVKGLEKVEGRSYAGGFGGNVYTGGLADAGGLSLLGELINADVGNLLRVLDVYIPYIYDASVRSAADGEGEPLGYSVLATDSKESYAGGFLGYGRGVQIKNSNVEELKYTPVDDSNMLNAEEYAVRATSAAGGYAGVLDIGNAASVGGGLGLLGDAISTEGLLQTLSVAAAKVENSSVKGCPGGFSILASGDAQATSGKKDAIGHAGGYVGAAKGAQITNSDALNFAYIVGQESAGGYAGTIEPGNVASVVGNAEVLGGLVSASSLASILESFIPMIYTSKATAVPCGGYVWADGLTSAADNSSEVRARGMAGGYVGHSVGGRIEGSAEKEAAVYRIRKVYGGEYAGGFTGYMEAGNVADTGSLSLLFGLIKVSSPISVLQAVYPTETNTAAYGPLRGLTVEEWNDWVEFVGSDKAYGNQLKPIMPDGVPVEGVDSEKVLEEYINAYAYGYDVTAGRTEPGRLSTEGGAAGGYAGRMEGGKVTNALAQDVKNVTALRSAGGFAGEMLTGSVANVEGIEIAGLDIVGNLNLLNTFVPVINGGTAVGYRSGARIKATGVKTDDSPNVGYAGGYVGHMIGGQIGMDTEAGQNNIENLRRVDGTYYVGGYAGQIESGSALDLNTDDAGLLNDILKYMIGNAPGDLAQVLNATVSTIDDAHVNAWDDWGIIVNGAYDDGSGTSGYAQAAGGFAGSITGAVIGEKRETPAEDGGNASDEDTWFPGDDLTAGAGTSVEKLRQVTGGNHAGGYVGVADVGSAASVGSDSATTGILGLLKLGNLSVADIFRTYVYQASVTGSPDDGLTVSANMAGKQGTLDAKVYSGNAGGFAGSFLDATVENTSVSGLNAVRGINNTGGFIGLSGKSGLVDLNQVEAAGGLLNGAAGVLDVFGSTVTDCSVAGMQEGYTVRSSGGERQRSGGVIGYADLARVETCDAENLKQVASGQVAGGYAGETSYAYLADIEVSSVLLKALVPALNAILKIVGESGLTGLGSGIQIDLGIIKVQLLGDGNVIALNLLGLPIEVRISEDEDKSGNGMLAVNIGDSTVEIPYYNWSISEDDIENNPDIKISLIKANRTKIAHSSVSGIPDGYDVYGGGAGNDNEAVTNDQTGQAGGFIGYNNEGLLENNSMFYCDVVKGEPGLTGPFIGQLAFDSAYEELGNTEDKIVGNNNTYKIYRNAGSEYTGLTKNIQPEGFETEQDWSNIYVISHYGSVKAFSELKDVKMTTGVSGAEEISLDAYVSSAEAKLMDGTDTYENGTSETPEPSDAQDPCDEYIDLTINKVWVDRDNQSGKRPASLTLQVWKTYTGADGEPVSEKIQDLTLTENDHENTQNTWQYIYQDLPAYVVGENGEKYWITYEVKEPVVPEDYELAGIKTSEDGFTITVTNKLPWYDLLPDAGGVGTRLIYLAGILLVLAAALSYFRSRSRMAEAAAGNGRPGSPGGRRRVRRRQRIHDRHSRR